MNKLFHPGEEVVCIIKDMKSYRGIPTGAPKMLYNSLQKVRSYYAYYGGMWWLEIEGTQDNVIYSECSFAKITQIGELLEDVNEVVLQNQIKRIHEIY